MTFGYTRNSSRVGKRTITKIGRYDLNQDFIGTHNNPQPGGLASNQTVFYAAVGGGGGGGDRHGGGAGGGGFKTGSFTGVAGTAYTITVGAGGNAGISSDSSGAYTSYNNGSGYQGGDSSIAGSGLSTITCYGGGGGATYSGYTATGTFGSGGGGGGQSGSAAGSSGTSGQGNTGGNGNSAGNANGGGGGGAGSVGRNADADGASFGGEAGWGASDSILNVTQTGQSNLIPSWYFNGNASITAANSAVFAFGTGDFTVEFWVYLTASTTNQCFIDFRSSSASSTGLFFGLAETGYFQTWKGSSIIKPLINPALNTWHHVALVRSSSTLKIYFNGVEKASGADSTNYTDQYCKIGYSASAGEKLTGYLSDVRVVKGTAVYTTGFNTPKKPLNPITNTSLLTCNSSTAIDKSTNAITLTNSSAVVSTTFSPFNSHSHYFSGSNYLSIPHNSALDMGTGNFTIEFWMNATSWSSGTAGVVGKKASDSTNGWQIYRNSTSVTKMSARLGQQNDFYTTSTITVGEWNHWALVKSGTTLYWFKNGVLDATGSSSVDLTDTTAGMNIGYAQTWSAYGNLYLSNLRIVKGTALYTTAFTPPSSPLTPIPGTSFLSCNTAAIADYSPTPLTITNNSSVSQDDSSPFKSYRYYFNDAAYLQIASQASLALGSGNFTWECWIYPNVSSLPSNDTIYDQRNGTNGGGVVQPCLQLTSSAGFEWYVAASSVITSGTSTVKLQQWQHLAICRSSGTTKMFIDGVQVGSSYTDANNYPAGGLRIGTSYDGVTQGSRQFNGYISNLRVVVGTALYTSAFTPTKQPLTAITGTQLLTCNAGTIVDTSTNAFTITNTSVTSQSYQTPYTDKYYIGGGGGGGGNALGYGGVPALGGGGGGGYDNEYPWANAITNTGGGGGGCRSSDTVKNGGNGGSGVVVLKMAAAATATTGSPTVIVSPVDGYTYYKFTGTGTITI